MAARLDREAVWSPGTEQVYAAAPGVRIYRHTFVAVGADGLLRSLTDTPGLQYVGVAAQAVYAEGTRASRVLQGGEGRFRYAGTALQEHVGLVAYAVDDETVTTEPGATVQCYAVGRVGCIEPDGCVRVVVTGYATTNVVRFLRDMLVL